MLLHILCVARLPPDDRLLPPPPKNIALKVVAKLCSKHGGDAQACAAELQTDANFVCKGAARAPQCRRGCYGWKYPTNTCHMCECKFCSHCLALGLPNASPCAARCIELGSTVHRHRRAEVRQQRVNHSVVSQRALRRGGSTLRCAARSGMLVAPAGCWARTATPRKGQEEVACRADVDARRRAKLLSLE